MTDTLRDAAPAGDDHFPTGKSEQEVVEGLFEMLESDPEFAEEDHPDADQKPDPEGDEGPDPEDPDEDDDEEESDEDDSKESTDDDEEDDAKATEDLHELPDGSKATLEELKRGYLREADYTRKRQRDSEEHRSAMAETREVREKYSGRLEVLDKVLKEMGPQAPDPALRQSNPGEYAAQVAEYQQYQQTLQGLDKARAEVAEQVSEEQAAEYRQHLATQREKILSAVPEWRDDGVRAAEFAKLQKFATEKYGFTEVEFNGVTHAGLLLMLRENYQLQEQRSKGKKKIEEKRRKGKRKLNPGGADRSESRPSKTRRKAIQAANQRLAKSGSIDDAARAIELALGDDL